MKYLSMDPIFKPIWKKLRERRIWRKHAQVVEFWRPRLEDYFAQQNMPFAVVPQRELKPNNVIWQYWGQGFDDPNLPKIVRYCCASVDKFKGDYQVIRLDDESVKDYLKLPDFVWEKRETSALNRTFFSDLLRLALLKTYGGIWLDATVFLTAPIPEYLTAGGYFMYQRHEGEREQKFWLDSYAYYWGWNPAFKVRVLNSIFFAHKDNAVVSALLDLMLHYWEEEDTVIDYFFFQILYTELIQSHMPEACCETVSDVLPHLLQTKINGAFKELDYKTILAITGIHKMSYFSSQSMDNFNQFLTLLGGSEKS